MVCGFVGVIVAGKQWRETHVLAQAGLSRLGETCRNMPDSHSSSRSGGELSFERGDICWVFNKLKCINHYK